jgi:hypothetical protein
MKCVNVAFAAACAILPTFLMAQSSGNFSANVNTTKCLIDDSDGTLTGGVGATLLETTIKTPNASQTALLIRPSLVTGLFTRTKVDETTTSSTAFAGVRVRVLLDGKVVAPGTPVGAVPSSTQGWVYYDKRWQQINQNFLSQIAACALDTTLNCNLELILSTLSAHSFDFVAPDIGGGVHTVKVEWRFDDSDSSGGNAAACVGPAVLTVTQTKAFSQSGGIEIN